MRHFDKLTLYLDVPQLAISNDFSERMLRMEKLIENNSLFRNNIGGRIALDINRTIFQSAIAAKAPMQDYVTFVLKNDPEHVLQNPSQYTAKKFAQDYKEEDC